MSITFDELKEAYAFHVLSGGKTDIYLIKEEGCEKISEDGVLVTSYYGVVTVNENSAVLKEMLIGERKLWHVHELNFSGFSFVEPIAIESPLILVRTL